MVTMRVKQQDGSTVDIPIGKGADGKSAYKYAQEGGYTGTEAEFMALLANMGYDYGTEDLVAGSSELATGRLYFVYE